MVEDTPPQKPKKIVLGYYGQNADSSSSSSEEESETSRPPSSEGQAVGGAQSEEANPDAPGDSDSDIQEVPIEEGSRAGLGWIPPEYPSPVSVLNVLDIIHQRTVSLRPQAGPDIFNKMHFFLAALRLRA